MEGGIGVEECGEETGWESNNPQRHVESSVPKTLEGVEEEKTRRGRQRGPMGLGGRRGCDDASQGPYLGRPMDLQQTLIHIV